MSPPPKCLLLVGTGLAAYRQFAALVQKFDLRALVLPPDNVMPFAELVEAVTVSVARRGWEFGYSGLGSQLIRLVHSVVPVKSNAG